MAGMTDEERYQTFKKKIMTGHADKKLKRDEAEAIGAGRFDDDVIELRKEMEQSGASELQISTAVAGLGHIEEQTRAAPKPGATERALRRANALHTQLVVAGAVGMLILGGMVAFLLMNA
jgi:hypothetical protein